MKLQHTLGGLEGLGPVTFEKRVFVEPWEKRIFGIHVAMMALSSQLPLPATPSKFNTAWTWADLRKGAESLNPFDYFKYRYYEKWLGGISGYFVEKGYITEAELAARTEQILSNSTSASAKGGDPAIDQRIITYLEEGDSPKREATIKPASASATKSWSRTSRPSSTHDSPGICATAWASSKRSIRATTPISHPPGPME
jgi:hypothetical protein